MALSKVQKVTLAVGVPLTVAVIGWGGLNAVAAVGRGSEHISEQIPVSDGKLSFHLGSGSIRMQSGSASTASLDGTVNYSLFRPAVNLSTDQNGTSAGFSCSLIVGWCDAQTTLSLPASVTSATLSTDEGDITVDGAAGLATLTLSTSMGGVTANGVTAQDVSAHSSMGDITLTFTRAPSHLSVTDSMGDINIILPPGHYNITDGSGSDMGTYSHDVSADSNSTHVIYAHSDMGDVSISES